MSLSQNNERVDSSRYDEEWIATAWGEDNLTPLLKENFKPRPRVKRAMDLCNLEPGQSLLDIACGRGEVPALAADIDAYAIGIDYSTAILKLANQVKNSRKERSGCNYPMHLLQADATRLPFEEESFDRITMLDIIEHLTPTQLDSMFIEVRRLLKPNGYAVIHTLPNRWVYEIGYKFAKLLLRHLPDQPRSEIEQQIHINEQDLPRLSHTIKKCGFNSSIWLEQYMPAQARWNVTQTKYSDNRDILYPKLAGTIGRLLDLVSLTPAKLILSNDIFGILWKAPSNPCKVKTPIALTERFVCSTFQGSPK